MKNICILTLLIAAFFVSCRSNKGTNGKMEKDFYLSIEKTPCFGKCPMYVMTVNGNRTASLNAKRFMDKLGKFNGTLTQESMIAINGLTNKCEWDTYDEEYITGYSDLPSTIIEFSSCGSDTTTIRFESNKAPEEIINLATHLSQLKDEIDWKAILKD